MKNWIRIILVSFVLVGGTTFFGYWSFVQFDNTFEDLNTSYTAIAPSFSLSFKKDAELASTSPKISEVLTTPIDLELSFTFPQKGDVVYIGCIYPVSWQSTTTINSLEMVLIDAGTKEAIGPIASGLAKENKIESGSQSLDWKVGVVWPGEYYIKISKINNTERESRSKVFRINKIPVGISIDEQENICK